jgi:ferredoxin-fold anticodon binding domain-containing protein
MIIMGIVRILKTVVETTICDAYRGLVSLSMEIRAIFIAVGIAEESTSTEVVKWSNLKRTANP